MKNTLKISALLIASFAFSSISAQSLRGNSRLPNNANRATDGKEISNSVNSQKTQSINTKGQNTNVNFAQPNKNLNSISNSSNVSVTNSSSSSVAQPTNTSITNPVQSSSQNNSSLNQAAAGKIRSSKGLRSSKSSRSQKAGTNKSGQ